MKKSWLLSLITVPFLSSCSIFPLWAIFGPKDNGVVDFGNIEFVGEQMIVNDTTYFKVDGKLYVDAGAMQEGLGLDRCIGAKNGLDYYSYKFYTIQNQTDDIIVCDAFSKFNLVSGIFRIYISKECEYVPSTYLDDFPHHDTWLNGGLEKDIAGNKYACYGSYKTGLALGDVFATENNKTYYNVINHDCWLATQNEHSSEMHDLYYQINTTNELPGDIVWASYTY